MNDEISTYTYLCIGCPLGCRLELDENPGGDIIEVRGSSCRKGDRYAVLEHTDPRRVVTTTVAVEGGRLPRLPVRTSEAIPKSLVRDACRALAAVSVPAPVSIGQVIVADLLGTGADVIATRDLPRSSNCGSNRTTVVRLEPQNDRGERRGGGQAASNTKP